MNQKKKDNDFGFYVKITQTEDDMIKKMKSVYCINMSQFVRNSIRTFYAELESNNETKNI